MKNLSNIQAYPLFSTLIGAFIVSLISVMVWMIMFFLVTLIVNLETPKSAFLPFMLITVAVEATALWISSLNSVNYYSKPHEGVGTRSGSKDFTALRLSVVFVIIFIVSTFQIFLTSSHVQILTFSAPSSFVGMENSVGYNGFQTMLHNWLNCISDPLIILSIALVFLIKMIIYKKDHRRNYSRSTHL